jgi:exodeoxyribonuclease III
MHFPRFSIATETIFSQAPAIASIVTDAALNIPMGRGYRTSHKCHCGKDTCHLLIPRYSMNTRNDSHTAMIKIATWNVNSVSIRTETVKTWLNEAQPDVLCLQEIKCQDTSFPHTLFEDQGYNVAVHGQKTYNGVAILSKWPISDVVRGLTTLPDDEHARYLEAVISLKGEALRVASIYLPNGNPSDSAKYDYKLAWMAALKTHARALLQFEEPLILAGDYNVIATAKDVYDAAAWVGDALYKIETRQAYRRLLNLGLRDAFRACNGEPAQYSFWDYQAGAWQKNHGLRIDQLLLSPEAAARLRESGIDKYVRGQEKPSDHVPVWALLS